jgi:hypothetical protein
MLSILVDEFILPDSLLNEKLEFLVEPLLLKGKVTTLFAPASVGKSTFSYNIVLNALRNNTFRKVICVFSDADTTNNEFQTLVSEYFDRSNLSRSRFIPIFPSSPKFWKAFMRDVAQETFKESEVDLIVIDSLEQFAELCGLDFHRSVGRIYSLFRRLAIQGVAVLVLHHANKQGQEFAGRATIINQSDVMYRLRRAGKFKWFLDCYKHRGSKLLNNMIDYYAELKDGQIEFSNEVVDDRYGYVVSLVKQVLQENGALKQYEIVKEVKRRAENEIGVIKIRDTLSKYDGIFWKAYRGEKNSLIYELLESPEKIEQEEEIRKETKEKAEAIREIEALIDSGLVSPDSPEFEKLEKYGVWNFSDLVAKADDIPLHVLSGFLEDLKSELGIIEEEGLDF